MFKVIGLLAAWAAIVHGVPYRSPISSYSIASDLQNYDYDSFPQNVDGSWDELVEVIRNEPAVNTQVARQEVQTQPSTTSSTVTPKPQKAHKHRVLHGVGR